MEKRHPDQVAGAQALLRGLDVLFAIGNSPRPLRFRDLQVLVDLPKGTLHRLLAALQSQGVVRLDPRTRIYHVGHRVSDLAHRSLDQSHVVRAAKPEMVRLARELRRSVCLYVADVSGLYVLDFEDPDPAQGQLARVWPRAGFTDSAPGIALLAATPPDRRPDFVEGAARLPEVSLCLALGYAVAETIHVPSVAAAIVGEGGAPMAVLCCLLDPNEQSSAETLHHAGRLIAEAARRASRHYAGSSSVSRLDVPPTPPAPVSAGVLNLDTGRDYVGENPIWLEDSAEILWLDVLAPALRTLDTGEPKNERLVLPQLTGGLVRAGEQDLILLGEGGIYRFDRRTRDQRLLFNPENHQPDNRFNSAAVAPDGALWVGSMAIDHTPGRGALYRVEADLRLTRASTGIGLPKNPAWSPDGRTLYISDGATGTLLAFDCDHASGDVRNRRDVMTGTGGTGIPNGIAIDSAGQIWVAMLGGWAVHCYSQQGELRQVIGLPVPMPTALCFGGPDLRTLFITTTDRKSVV